MTFAYEDEPERNVLEDVSFLVKPGQTIALVGPTERKNHHCKSDQPVL